MRRSLLLALACCAAARADASQVFTNETQFRAALGLPSRTYGFDNLSVGTVVDDQLHGIDFHSSGTVQNGAANTPPRVLAATGSPIDFTFLVPTRGVGFYNTSAVDEVLTYAAPGPGGTLFQSLVAPGTFLGYISDTPIGIGTIGWIGPPNTTFSIDTIIFGTDSDPVPSATPGVVVGLGVLLLGVASLRLRRRNQGTTTSS